MNETSDIVVIPLDGNLDIGQQFKLKTDLSQKIPTEGPVHVVLDFKAVNFIDSACLGILISMVRKVRKAGGDILLANLQNEVSSIFQITRLDKIFKIYNSVDEATRAF